MDISVLISGAFNKFYFPDQHQLTISLLLLLQKNNALFQNHQLDSQSVSYLVKSSKRHVLSSLETVSGSMLKSSNTVFD